MKSIKAKEFDKMFDEGKDITEYLDTDKAMSIDKFKAELERQTQTIDLDLPVDIIEKIDKEAKKIGVEREALLKIWIAERLKEELAKPL